MMFCSIMKLIFLQEPFFHYFFHLSSTLRFSNFMNFTSFSFDSAKSLRNGSSSGWSREVVTTRDNFSHQSHVTRHKLFTRVTRDSRAAPARARARAAPARAAPAPAPACARAASSARAVPACARVLLLVLVVLLGTILD